MAEVLAVVRAAAAGDALLAPDLIAEIARRVAESATLEGDRRAIEGLPLRALQVLRLLATGERTEAICHLLHIRPRTVDAHVRHLTAKLGVRSRLEAVVFAYRHRLVA